jgi:hypothetical protein
MSCLMCGGEIKCAKSYGENMVTVGRGLMQGEGILKDVGKRSKKIEKAARKTAGKKNLKKVAGQAIEKGIPATAGFLVGTAAGAATGGNPVAGAVAGAAAEEGVRRSGVGKMARKKAGLGMKKESAWITHVKNVAKQKGIAYGEALKIASQTYKKN